jgi:hypothetical protein
MWRSFEGDPVRRDEAILLLLDLIGSEVEGVRHSMFDLLDKRECILAEYLFIYN